MLPRKLILSIPILFLLIACDNSDPDKEQRQKENVERQEVNILETYRNASYNIRLQFPEGWIAVEQQDVKPEQNAIYIFEEGTGVEKELPLAVHAGMNHSYIAIWPKGMATELPYSEYALLEDVMHSPALNFAAHRDESKLLLLKNGAIWGYFLVPRNPPPNWSDHGFIYAQIQVNNSNRVCYDEQTGEQLSPEECDFLEGDKVVRTGQIDEEDAEVIRNILESISLAEVQEQATTGESS